MQAIEKQEEKRLNNLRIALIPNGPKVHRGNMINWLSTIDTVVKAQYPYDLQQILVQGFVLNRLDVYKEREDEEDELVPTRHNAVSIYAPRLNEHENNVDDFDVEVNNYDDFVARFHEKQIESNSAGICI